MLSKQIACVMLFEMHVVSQQFIANIAMLCSNIGPQGQKQDYHYFMMFAFLNNSTGPLTKQAYLSRFKRSGL